MRRRPQQSIVANPVLVGAVTTLVVVVAVFLAYNANNGLPFVPTKQLNVQISNGANLVPGNEVREGGFRVGVIEDMIPVPLPDGTVGAELKLKLDKKVGDIPVDTTVKIRPRSSLGLKYLEVTRGRSKKSIPDGGTLPATQANVPVELDEFYNMFDERTRDGARENLKGFGNALTGRGEALNRTIQVAPELFRRLEPVARNLAAPRTRLEDFFKELGDAARIVAPVAATQAKLFTDMADTFEAFSRDEQALKDTISKAPPTLDAGISSFRVQRPFLRDTADFSHDLRFATAELRRALPTLNSALQTGTPVVRRSVQLNEDLQGAMGALRDLAEAPTTNAALRGLTATVTTLNPQLRFYGPYITVCNTWNYWWTLLAEHLSEPDPTGSSQRALLNSTGRQDDSIGSMGANEPANGQNVTEGTPQFLHGQAYGAAVDKSGNADCENGQRGYPKRLAKYADPFYKVVNDARTPGNQGPVYDHFDAKGNPVGLGPTRVPKGETFTAEPETGFTVAP